MTGLSLGCSESDADQDGGRMMGITETDRHYIREFDASHSPLKDVLVKFCELKADEYRRSCTQRMSHVPREVERAADYAAKAQAYEKFIEELFEI
jgi:hypothetical protein